MRQEKCNMFKSGFVSIVGRPNVGKSTLMNNVVGEKIAIMSDKPQTTRNTIQAVYTDEEAQVVFLDTPGIHKPKNKLGEFMVKSATDAFKNVDLVLFVVDESKKIGHGDRKIIDDLKNIKTPVVLVLNKIDQLNEEELFDLMKMYNAEGVFDARGGRCDKGRTVIGKHRPAAGHARQDALARAGVPREKVRLDESLRHDEVRLHDKAV